MHPTPRTPPPEGCIDTEVVDEHILLIGINRPAKYNGWTPPMFEQLAAAYTRLDDEPGLRVGVLHAFGPHFTAGLDLPVMSRHFQSGGHMTPKGLVDPFDLGYPGYRRRAKPMIAALKGICFTVAIELMLAADIAVAADDCRFKQMEVQRGIMPSGGATLRMRERAGLGDAMVHLLTGDEFGSAEALHCHYVHRVVPAAEVLDAAVQLARRIAEQAPLAVVATRQNVIKALEQGQAAAVADLLSEQRRLAGTDDAAEGVRSFVEKRPARFTGR